MSMVLLHGDRSETELARASLGATGTAVGDRKEGLSSFPPPLASNPYQRILYEHLAGEGITLVEDPAVNEHWLGIGWLWRWRHDVRYAHIHWPQGLYRSDHGPARARPLLSWVKACLLVVRLTVARALRYRLIWTVHQVDPHESTDRRLDRFAARALARLCQVLLVHDEGTASDVRERLGREPAVVPHGSYIGIYPKARPREVVREELGIAPDQFAFLCFGGIRAYKELGLLLNGFGQARLETAVLIIAGGVADEAAAERVRSAADADPRIRPLLRFIPDSEVSELFDAADAAVIARAKGTSGSLVLGLSMGVPLIVADTPAYRELIAGEQAGWLHAPGDAQALAAALEAAAGRPAEARAKGRAALALADRLRWPPIAARTAELMRGEATVARAGTDAASHVR